MPLKIESYSLSDVGLVRPHNEDFWGLIEGENFFALADGMGGHASGEVAAEMAVTEVCDLMREVFADPAAQDRGVEDIADLLSSVIMQANELIFEKGCSSEELHGMGTTLCCLYLHEEGVVHAHVGDSRIYRMRKGQLSLLTQDHSLLREMLDTGELQESEAEEFVYRNILTKAVGTDPKVTPSVHVDPLVENDLYLLCSDGLTDLLSKDEIEEIVDRYENLEKCGKSLVAAALEKGGHDNTTVVLVRFKGISDS